MDTSDYTESEEYAKFIKSMVHLCHCDGQYRPCDGVLAGGLCDNIHNEEPEYIDYTELEMPES